MLSFTLFLLLSKVLSIGYDSVSFLVATTVAASVAAIEVEVSKPGLNDAVTNGQKAAESLFCQSTRRVLGALEANGTQFKNNEISCSSTPIGMIPEVGNMFSTVFVSPDISNGQKINGANDLEVVLDTVGLVAGFFDDPNIRYYINPSTLSNEGSIQGHQHVTLQFMGDSQDPLDSQVFQFFKGINDAANDAEGRLLSTVIPKTAFTQNGLYRLCSLSGSFGHQSVLSPVFIRGPTNDCIRFEVEGATVS